MNKTSGCFLGMNPARRRIEAAGHAYEAKRSAVADLAGAKAALQAAERRATVAEARAEMAESQIRRMLVNAKTPSRDPRVDAVIEDVAREHGLSPQALLGRTRKKGPVSARRAAANRLHDMGITMAEIGRALDRDHSTIVHLISGRKKDKS